MSNSLLTLATLSEIAIAINLAYINLPSLRYSEKLREFTKTKFDEIVTNNSIGGHVTDFLITLKDKENNIDFLKVNRFGVIGRPWPTKEIDIASGVSDRVDGFRAFDFWFMPPSLNLPDSPSSNLPDPPSLNLPDNVGIRRNLDHLTTSLCFMVSLMILVNITANGFSAFGITEYVDHLSYSALMVFFCGITAWWVRKNLLTLRKKFGAVVLVFLGCVFIFYALKGGGQFVCGPLEGQSSCDFVASITPDPDFVALCFFGFLIGCITIPTALVLRATSLYQQVEGDIIRSIDILEVAMKEFDQNKPKVVVNAAKQPASSQSTGPQQKTP